MCMYSRPVPVGACVHRTRVRGIVVRSPHHFPVHPPCPVSKPREPPTGRAPRPARAPRVTGALRAAAADWPARAAMADRRGWGCCWLGRCATSVAADAGDVDVTEAKLMAGRQTATRAWDPARATRVSVWRLDWGCWQHSIRTGTCACRRGGLGAPPARAAAARRETVSANERRRGCWRRAAAGFGVHVAPSAEASLLKSGARATPRLVCYVRGQLRGCR